MSWLLTTKSVLQSILCNFYLHQCISRLGWLWCIAISIPQRSLRFVHLLLAGTSREKGNGDIPEWLQVSQAQVEITIAVGNFSHLQHREREAKAFEPGHSSLLKCHRSNRSPQHAWYQAWKWRSTNNESPDSEILMVYLNIYLLFDIG